MPRLAGQCIRPARRRARHHRGSEAVNAAPASIFNEWQRQLATAPSDAKLKVFTEAAADIANCVGSGISKGDFADKLLEMAAAHHFFDVGEPKVGSIIIERIEIVEIERSDRARLDQAALERRWEEADAKRAGANGKAHDASKSDEPLPYVDLALDLTPRQWLVPERIPMRNVSSMSGEGAIGKSLLLMQLSGAVVLGKSWIG